MDSSFVSNNNGPTRRRRSSSSQQSPPPPLLLFDLTIPSSLEFGSPMTVTGSGGDHSTMGSQSLLVNTPCKSLMSVMKASFSMSSLRDGSPDTETSISSPATLPRRKRRERRRVTGGGGGVRQREKKDEFWEALQSNYDYLMDGGLIQTCKEANGELSWDEEDLDVSYTWTFNEFLKRYSELSDWMERVLPNKGGVEELICSDETKYRSSQMKLFNEQSLRLNRRYPSMRDEIQHRTEHLNARWKEIEGSFVKDCDRDEVDVLRGDITCQIRWLRKWLREIEDQLGPLTLGYEFTKEEIVDRLNRQQVLQKEIESRCKSVLAIVKLCERFRRCFDLTDCGSSSSSGGGGGSGTKLGGGSSSSSNKYEEGEDDDDEEEEEEVVVVVSEEGEEHRKRKGGGYSERNNSNRRRKRRGGGDHNVRVANNLQRRFHALWIRSLEWQCWLEGLLSGQLHQNHHWKGASFQNSPGEEPRKKYPRLSENYHSCKVKDVMVDCAPLTMDAAAKEPETTTEVGLVDSDILIGAAVGNKGDIVSDGDVGPVRNTVDHHDVGYSSESSAHLSNEESAGEFVRVYTYTSAEATSPRVLEVVVDGEHRPRRTPPREVPESGDSLSTPTNDGAKPNCATYYFCHEDSDHGDRHRLRRTCLDFGGGVGKKEKEADDDLNEETSSSSDASSPSSTSEGEEEDGVCCRDETHSKYPEGIHQLVKQAELLVKKRSNGEGRVIACPSRRRRQRQVADNSSCDASGEYTSSGSDSEGPNSGILSSLSTDEDQNGSVIHLKHDGGVEASVGSPLKRSATSENGSSVNVVRRRKNGGGDRATRDRPWSFIEMSQYSKRLGLSPFSLSEGALHRLERRNSSTTAFSSSLTVGETSPGGSRRPKRSINGRRRPSNHRGDSGSDAKCHSLGSLGHSGSSDNGRWKTSYLSNTSDGTDDATLECPRCEGGRRDGGEDDSEHGRNFVASKDRPLLIADDISSMSDQAWDDYQDPPYLSDAYSEQAVDDDAARKVLEFGDDYRAFIESHSDGTSTPSLPPTAMRRPTRQSSSRSRGDSSVLDSESDLDDLNDVLRRHVQQLHMTGTRLREEMASDPSEPGRSSRVGEVLATCQTHLRCLEKVWEQLRADNVVVVLPDDVSIGVYNAGEKLRVEWLKLLMEAESFQLQLCQVGQFVNEVKAVRSQLNSLLFQTEATFSNETIRNRASIDSLLSSLKEHEECLSKVKASLTDINFKVHSYVSQTGRDVPQLKVEVVQVYRIWDQTNSRLKEREEQLEKMKALWDDYNTTKEKLTRSSSEEVEAFSSSSVEAATNVVEIGRLERDSSSLRETLQHLRLFLESSPAWDEIISGAASVGLVNLGKENDDDDGCVRKEHLLEGEIASVLKETVCTEHSRQIQSSIRDEGTAKRRVIGPKRRSPSSFVWRVLKAAVPFQLAVAILFCLACILEPHCCNNVNNMNFSLAPQLRYVRGPPPI